jgi:hypothetical protein
MWPGTNCHMVSLCAISADGPLMAMSWPLNEQPSDAFEGGSLQLTLLEVAPLIEHWQRPLSSHSKMYVRWIAL